jgi:hypothetical protein
MKTLTFLQGVVYGLGMLQVHPLTSSSLKRDVENIADQIPLILTNGMKFRFAINRGVCPKQGRIAIANELNDMNSFDVVGSWCSPEIAEYLNLEHSQSSEARLPLSEIINVINHFGGIDYIKSWEYCMSYYKED